MYQLDKILINSKQLKDFISTFDFHNINKEKFKTGIELIQSLSMEEEIEILIIKAFFNKEIFHDYIEAQKLNEIIIQKCTENEYYYYKLIGLLSYFDLCSQFNTIDTEIDYDHIIVEIRMLLNLEDLKGLGLLEKEIQFNIMLCNYELYNGNYNRALDHINDSFSSHLKFLMDFQSKNFYEILLLNLRAYLNFNLGNYQDAIMYMVRCLSLTKDLSTELREEIDLTILNNQCLIYRTIGEYELAQDFSQQLEEKLQKNESKLFNPFELSNIYNNIGLFEAEQGNYAKSLSLLNRGLAIHQIETNSLQEQAIGLGNIARILGESGDFVKAGETYTLSLQMYDKSGSHKELVEKICWCIDLLLTENNLILSEEYIKMAEHYAMHHDSGREMLLVNIRKAKFLILTEQLNDAKQLFIFTRSTADMNNQHSESIQCSLYLAEIALLSNDVTELKWSKGM